MTQGPEREAQGQKPDVSEGIVKEIPETPEVNPELMEVGVTSVPSQVTAQVTDDKTGKPLMQSPSDQTVTVTLPANPTQLATWSKGDASNPLTWLSMFWLRVVKKALHFGWRVMTKNTTS